MHADDSTHVSDAARATLRGCGVQLLEDPEAKVDKKRRRKEVLGQVRAAAPRALLPPRSRRHGALASDRRHARMPGLHQMQTCLLANVTACAT